LVACDGLLAGNLKTSEQKSAKIDFFKGCFYDEKFPMNSCVRLKGGESHLF
jgi:hypothetical protein